MVHQWRLRGAIRCMKAWSVYVLTRKLRREIVEEGDDEPLSGDEWIDESANDERQPSYASPSKLAGSLIEGFQQLF